ncbi:MAG: hypothetical protein V4671_15440 [Armatimonadota bacterium]
MSDGYIVRVTSKSFTFPCCWVHTDSKWTETVFHDGTRVTAVPQEGDDYRSHAQDLGYSGECAAEQMSREHEILHTFLADRLRNGGASPTLWAVAHGQTGVVAPVWEQEEEEGFVLAFQRFLNGQEAGDEIRRLESQGISAETLKQDAFALLRGSESVHPANNE